MEKSRLFKWKPEPEPEKPKRIHIQKIPYWKHRELKFIKEMLGMTWEEMLVDFYLELWKMIRNVSDEGIMYHFLKRTKLQELDEQDKQKIQDYWDKMKKRGKGEELEPS